MGVVAKIKAQIIWIEFFHEERNVEDQSYYEGRIDLAVADAASDGPPLPRRAPRPRL
jgi:hypothetical protein